MTNDMNSYEAQAKRALRVWQREMQKKPNLINRFTKKIQLKINSLIPEKVHNALTTVIKQMIRGVLYGAELTTSKPNQIQSLPITEAILKERIEMYKKSAAAEGGITGAGGILMSFADFPLLIGIKMKMLFDIASTYGYDMSDYKERVYILHVFQLAFSSTEHRNNVYQAMVNWNSKAAALPEDIHEFNWRSFQQEYRDYIDLAKLAQMIPVVGAAVGLVVNYRLLSKLGETATNAYRMRLIEDGFL